MAYPSPRRLQLRRGNASAISSYLGYAGELVVDTTNWTLYVHDGVTVGGYAATVNTASISGNINSILNGTAVFGNIIPSANTVYSLGNITHQWKSLFVSNSTIYVGGVPLSIDPTGNLTVNGNTIPTVGYVNASVANVTVDLSAYALNANVTAANVGLKGYVDQANTIQSSQLTSANLGIIGYIDQANTIQSAQVGAANLAITAANVGMKGYVDSQTYSNINVSTYLASHIDQTIGGNLTIQGNLTVNGNVTYISVNNIIIDDNIIQLANFNTADSLDLGVVAHRTPSGQPMQHTGLIRDASANQWRLFSNVVAPPGTTVDFTDAVYDDLQLGNIVIAGKSLNWANASIDQTSSLDLSITGDGQVSIRSLDGTYQWTFGTNGTTQFPDNTINAGANKIDIKSSDYAELWFSAVDGNWQSNPTWNQNAYLYVQNDGVGIQNVRGADGYGGNTWNHTWTFGTDGRLTLPLLGKIGPTDVNSFLTFNYGDDVELKAGDNLYLSGSVVTIRTDGNNNAWTFGTDGTLTLPGATAGETIATSGGYITVGNLLIGQGGSLFNSNNDSWSLSGNRSDSGVTISIPSNADAGNGLALYLENQISNVEIRSGSGTWTFGTGGTTQFPNSLILAPASQSITMQSDQYSQLMWENANLTVAPNMAINSNFYVTQNNATLDIGYRDGSSTQLIKSWYWNVDGNLKLPSGGYILNSDDSIYGGGDYSNVQVATYLPTYSGVVTASNVAVAGNVTAQYLFGNGSQLTGIIAGSSYSNVQVATYLPTYTGNIANVRLGVSGVLTFADGTTQTTAATGGGSSYSNVNVAAYLSTATINTTGNITAGNLITGGAFYVANITTTGSSGNISGANYITANVILTNGGWGNISQVANIQANAVLVSGNVTATYFLGNGALLTGIVAGSNYSNVQVAAYLNTQGYNLYSNVNVASYLSTATINTTGNITAQNLIGNISITGNVTGTSANVTLQAGAYTSVFDNQGNVRLPTAYVTGNVTANYFVGNGALLTGIAASSTYSNVQVATYLPTYSGVVGASNVFVSGNVTAQYFLGNGALLTGIASSYSNVQVATYLPTYTGNIANVRLSSSGALTFPDGTQQTTAAFGGGGNYGNANVAAFLPTYTGTNGITAVGTLATLSVTGNTTVGNLVGTEANTRIIANTYVTTFDIYGNVTFPGNVNVGGLGITMPTRPAFRVIGNGGQITATANITSSNWTLDYQQGNNLVTSTGVFTAPVTGLYSVHLVVRTATNNNLTINQVAVVQNNANIMCMIEFGSNTSMNHAGVSTIARLAVGDTLTAKVLVGTISFDGNDNYSVAYIG